MMSNLKTTEIFSLDLAEVKDSTGEFSTGYCVTNTKTDVKEFETFSLAEALQYIEMVEPMVTPLFDEKEAELVLHS